MARKERRNYGGSPKRREPTRPATGHTFLIVVEGEATETSYLHELRSRLKRKSAAVVVFHGDHTDPEGIVKEAVRLRSGRVEKSKQSAIEPYDQVWVVFDREKQNDPRKKQVPAAVALAQAEGIKVALSIPSFEYWLLLHYEHTTKGFDGCAAVKRALKKHIRDYEKGALPLRDLFDRIGTAITHGKRCRQHWMTAGGDKNPSTDVDLLLHELNDSAPADVRLFDTPR